MKPRLKEKYDKEITSAMMKEFGLKNKMAVPRLEKISINVGTGRLAQKDAKAVEQVAENISMITGQKPAIRHAKKAIAAFKLRAGMPVGLMVTLRGKRMYEFLDRLVNIALPRVRDFRGLDQKSFDGEGNYSLGITEHIVFPEARQEGLEATHGLQINIKLKNSNKETGYALLKHFGFPFRT